MMWPAVSVLGSLLWAVAASAQPAAPPAGEAPLSFKILVDQITAHFPVVRTEVVEATGQRVTLASGRGDGVQPGLELFTFREGRELFHPTTKKSLGRTEEPLGRLVVAEVFDNYSIATQLEGKLPQAGDRARVAPGKVRLTLLTLTTGPSARVVEAATQELVQELERTGRIQVVLGDQIGVWLGEQKISADELMRGKGVREAQQRFKAANLLALHFTTAQSKPFMDVRLFSAALDAPLTQTALFVPPSVKPKPTQGFSSGGGAGEVRVERRSLLARLLSGDWEPNTYSSGAPSIPIRQLAIFPFAVVSMDVTASPHDKIPRLAVTDGQKVFVYRIENQTLAAEWTFAKLMVGKILSVQLADLNGDGVLEVVVNRQDYKAGMLSYILTTRNGRPAVLVDEIPLLLLAVDETGEGVNRGLWAQQYSTEHFFTKGSATRYVLKEKDIAPTARVHVNDQFRGLGATFSNIAGKDVRVLAFVDERSRLAITSHGQEMWRSHTPVGGGLAQAHLQHFVFQTTVDKFVKVEPKPLAVDLDGDGIEEIVVPVNQDEAGRMAVVFRGPAGFRMQVVSSGFEGMVTGLGSIQNEGGYPSLVAAVIKRPGLVYGRGETQLLMTVAE
jgi:hypothetical protein